MQSGNIEFTYLMSAGKRYTFEDPGIRAWVERWCKNKVLNLFAGQTLLDVDEYRVDIDPKMPADAHMDAYDFVTTTDMRFDTVILDPPWNVRQAHEKYEGRYITSYQRIKEALSGILNPKARAIQIGYNTTCLGKNRGFEKKAILIVNNGGVYNDTLGVTEEWLLEVRLDDQW
jgi:hypothetical protein